MWCGVVCVLVVPETAPLEFDNFYFAAPAVDCHTRRMARVVACEFQSPCQFNAAIVAEGSPFLLVDLDLVHEQGPPNQWFPEGDGRRPNEWSDLRYYDLVEPASRENRTTQLLLAGRAGHGAFLPSDENWNMQLLDLSHCITSGGCLPSTTGRPITTMIINDRGFIEWLYAAIQ